MEYTIGAWSLVGREVEGWGITGERDQINLRGGKGGGGGEG